MAAFSCCAAVLLATVQAGCEPAEAREPAPEREASGQLLNARYTPPASLQFGVASDVRLSANAPVARFSFSLDAPARVEFHASSARGGLGVGPQLELVRWSGRSETVIATSGRGQFTHEAHVEAALAAGPYVLRVRASQRRASRILLDAECLGAGCPGEEPTCLFGETFFERASVPGLTLRDEVWFHAAAELPDDVARAQVVAALQQSSHSDVTNAEEAFLRADEHALRRVRFAAHEDGAQFVAWEYGAGDNSYGAYFAEGSADVLASIHDGDVLDCVTTR